MTQPLPITRSTYWPGVLVQVIPIAIIAVVVHALWPSTSWTLSIVAGALGYKFTCMVARWFFTKHHALGIQAYKRRDFAAAISHNLRSLEFFQNYPWVDRLRFIILGTSSPNSYRTIALCNLGYCEAMLAHRDAAENYFKRALEVTPDCANAEFGLKMLSGSSKQEEASVA